MVSMRRGLIVYFAKLIQSMPLGFLRNFEAPFVNEGMASKNSHRHIFILAVPRSGSTLLYQCLCHYFSVNYLSNLWNVFYKIPFIGGLISNRVCRNHKSNFLSNFGFVAGLAGPAEGYRFWSHWLNCYLDERSLSKSPFAMSDLKVGYLQKVLATLYIRTGRPFATAFLGHTLMPELVVNAFPDSVFIVLRRNPIAVAHSLLLATRVASQRWFSVVPNECTDLDFQTEHERVVSQVYWLYSRLFDFSKRHEVFFVDYSELCHDPNRVFENLQCWLNERNLVVELNLPLPSQFPMKEENVIDDPDLVAIKEAYRKASKLNGSLW